MKQEKNKNTFLMVVVMALPVVLGVMFLASLNLKSEETTISGNSLIIPEVDEIAGLDDDKAKIYRDEQTELRHKTSLNAQNIVSDKDFFAIDSDFGKEEGKKEQKPVDRETLRVLEQYREQENIIEKRAASGNTSHVPNVQSQGKTPPVSQVVSTSMKPVELSAVAESSPERPQRKSSMGVYSAGRSVPNSTEEVKMDQSKKYLRGILEEDRVIQNGSNVIFILSEDGMIEGTNHRRGSILYGRANQGNEFFEINIYQVKSAVDGNLYPANLIVFDENYNRGIRSEGFLNEASREEGTDAVTQTLDEATGGGSSVRALDVAARAITRTATKTVRNRPVTIHLKKGYKVYLQTKPTEK